MAVVQFGFATRGAAEFLPPLISGTTRGTSGSILQAEELSMTQVFLGPPEIWGENSLEKSPDTAINTTSHSRAASNEKGSTVISPNADFTTVPAARFAKRRTFLVGKLRPSRHLSISWPTAPDEPTMPTQSTVAPEAAAPSRQRTRTLRPLPAARPLWRRRRPASAPLASFSAATPKRALCTGAAATEAAAAAIGRGAGLASCGLMTGDASAAGLAAPPKATKVVIFSGKL
mmetsp:Transcript_39454/g.82667  ORF Transcript_39454/g.82667 Transcript_39454/m.82667 type:complete len:231 (-) Transcript_39454:64-756(-)